jgi:hypothetical protein
MGCDIAADSSFAQVDNSVAGATKFECTGALQMLTLA